MTCFLKPALESGTSIEVSHQITGQEVAWPFPCELLEHIFFGDVDVVGLNTWELRDQLSFFFEDGLDVGRVDGLARVLMGVSGWVLVRAFLSRDDCLPTHGLAIVLAPLPELHASNLGGGGVLLNAYKKRRISNLSRALRGLSQTYHEEVDWNTTVTRDPSSAVGESAEFRERMSYGQSSGRMPINLRLRHAHAEMFSLTPLSVIFPGTSGLMRSFSETLTSSRRI